MSEPRDVPRLVRRIFGALYVVLAFWVIGSGIVSVVPQIFWPGRAHGDAGPPAEGCAAAIDALQTDLLDRTGDAARDLDGRSRSGIDGPAEAEIDPTQIDTGAWLDTWDGRYRALEVPCGHHRSYSLLARVRYGVEEHILRTITETAESAAETRRAIDAELQQR